MNMKENNKAVLAATNTANSSRSHVDSQADSDFIRNFWRYQNYLNRLRAIHMGDIPEPTGEFHGDGIPRTAGGYPFKPLDWGGVMQV